MNDKKLEIGDVVTLRSSVYPMMTVKEISGNEVTCQWFNGQSNSYEIREAIFHLNSLRNNTQ